MRRTGFQFASALVAGLAIGVGGSWAQPDAAAMARWPEGEAGVDYNVLDGNGDRHGEWIRVWPDGTLYYEGQFDHGTPIGTFQFYYETGEVMSRIEHLDNPRFMHATHLRPDGSIRAEGGYITSEVLDENGEPVRVKHDHWSYYDAKGTLRIEEHWNDGVLDGDYAAYDGNGKVVEKGSYVQGEKDGVWATYNERGKALNRIGYASGQFHGDYEVNDDLGRNLIVGRHGYGQPIGAWVFYNPDRTVHVVRKFEDGEVVMERFENGLQAAFFDDDRPQLEVHWENGKRHGEFKEWHDNGEWVVVEQQDPRTGEAESRREVQGQFLAREGSYFQGELHGVVLTYNLEGRLVKQEVYDHGNLVEE